MAPVILDTEPQRFAAGETVKWVRRVDDYTPGDGFTLKYYFRGAGVFDIATTANTDDYSAVIAASVSRQYKPGLYSWTLYAEKGAGDTLERYLVDSGEIVVDQNVTVQNGDFRSHPARMLALIEKVLESRLDPSCDASVEQYMIGDRQFKLIDTAELRKMRASYAAQVNQEENPDAFGTTIEVCFGRA